MATRGLVLLAKDTFSAASTVSFDNVFSATYKQYKIVSNMTISTNNYANIRMRASGTDNASGNYNRQYIYADNTSIFAGRLTNETSFLGVFSPRSYASVVEVQILNPYQTSYTSMIANKVDDPIGASIIPVLTARGMTVTTSYDGFTVIPNAGTISGTITVYGLAQ